MSITTHEQDYADLKRAYDLLESPSLSIQLASLIGAPIEKLVDKLPEGAHSKVQKVIEAAFEKSMTVALGSMNNEPREASPRMHKALSALSGGVGGFFGFAALLVELPISTTIMMRAVMDIARSEGFDINDLDTKRACLQVFTLGGPGSKDDASETGYYLSRGFTAQLANQLSRELAGVAGKQVVDVGSNVVTRQLAAQVGNLSPVQISNTISKLIQTVAERFGVQITEKMALQAAPVFGAVSGATLNVMFTDFYQAMARGHFIMMRLEQKYGREPVYTAYTALKEKYEKKAGQAGEL